MRIGFFTDDYFPRTDGVTYTIKTWKEKLEERGHEVEIYYPAAEEHEPEHGEHPVHSFNNPFYEGHYFPLTLGLFDVEDLDIAHFHSPGPIGYSQQIKMKLRDTPSVYTFHTPLEKYFEHLLKIKPVAKVVEKLYLTLDNKFLDSFDAVTCSTPEIDRDVDSVQIPVGIDTEFFYPREEDYLENYRENGPVIGYSGRISEEKNLESVINLAEEFEGTIIIVGEGRYRKKLKKKAPDNVVFKDFLPREELPKFYSALDVFVTASTGDTLGLSPLEANACGTPVVAPNVYPFNHTITNGNGALYTYGDRNDFHDKVMSVLGEDLPTRESVMDYSVKSTIDQLEQLYAELQAN